MNKGIIAINKPANWTSFDIVNKLKFMLKPAKVGHLGTLDPMATGVLLVTVGKATKLFDLMQEKTKTYVAEFEFGYTTDTLDATGVVASESKIIPDIEEIEKIIPNFIGVIDQIPPKYSAKSINGVRAYDMARKGKEFSLDPKKITVYNIKILAYAKPKITLEIVCGSGTYIRAIGRDIAEALNTVATMTKLERIKVDNFSIENCQNIEDINKENVNEFIIPIEKLLSLPHLEVDDTVKSRLLNGLTQIVNEIDGNYMLIDEFDAVAIVKIENSQAKMLIYLG